MFIPFRSIGTVKRPTQGFFHVRNFVRDILIPQDTEEVTLEFTLPEMKAMYRPSLRLHIFDKLGDIEVSFCSVLGSKLIVQLARRTVERAHIKAIWEEKYLYDS